MLNKEKIEFFTGNNWCQGCRDWYKDTHKECPDCESENKEKAAIQELKDFQVFLLEKYGLPWFEENSYQFDHRKTKLSGGAL